MQEASWGKDEVTFGVGTREAFLALKVAGVGRDNRGIVFEGVVDEFGVAEGSIGVEEVVCASGELDPLAIRRKSSEMGRKRAEYFLGCN